MDRNSEIGRIGDEWVCLIRCGEEGVKNVMLYFPPLSCPQHKTFMITPWLLVLLVPVICTILEGWFTTE